MCSQEVLEGGLKGATRKRRELEGGARRRISKEVL